MDTIGFFYPVRGAGGAQYLFLRMAEYLIENTSYNVVLIDYVDGFIRSHLADKNYRFIEYAEGGLVSIQESITLVLSLSFAPLVERCFELSKTTRLFFWDLHPYNLVEQLALSGLYKQLNPNNGHRLSSLIESSRRRKLANFVEIAAENSGIAFMAERNKIYNQQLLRFSSEVEYLPIAIDPTLKSTSTQTKKSIPHEHSVYHIGWLSRLDDWKSRVLFRLINDIALYQEKHTQNIHLHIIGDGPARSSVENRCRNIQATMVGKIEGQELTNYILTYIDIGFAMGTSALEFAVRSVPTVLTSAGLPQDNLQQANAYRWLFTSQGYDLTAEESHRPLNLLNFANTISQCEATGKATIGGQCRNYAVKNHDINLVAAKFVEIVSRCQLTYGELKRIGFYSHSPFEQILFQLKKIYKAEYAS